MYQIKMETIKKNLPLILFTVFAVVFSLWYVGYVSSAGGVEHIKNRSLLRGIGKNLGSLGFIALALVYARSVLKIAIRQDSFWKRLQPLGIDEYFDVKKFSTKLFIVLNRTHAYLGVLAIVLIFLHCYLTGSYKDNLLLQIVLVLMALEGILGFMMKFRYSSVELKKKSYLIHRQFVIGMMILVFAAFGHLILGD
jgi:hypothetical protein